VEGLSKEQFDFTQTLNSGPCILRDTLRGSRNGYPKRHSAGSCDACATGAGGRIRAKDRVILETVPARMNRVKGPPK